MQLACPRDGGAHAGATVYADGGSGELLSAASACAQSSKKAATTVTVPNAAVRRVRVVIAFPAAGRFLGRSPAVL
jgi:hypothetical protein